MLRSLPLPLMPLLKLPLWFVLRVKFSLCIMSMIVLLLHAFVERRPCAFGA